MSAKGGSEILFENLKKHVDLSGVNVILSDCSISKVDKTRKNILWQHLSYDQPIVVSTQYKAFTDKIDQFVYVSGWQYEKFRLAHKTPGSKSRVIKNAIEPIEFLPRDSGKTRLIYTSTPWRGLDLLLDSFEYLNRDDVELDVYSSTVIYSKEFSETDEAKSYQGLLDRAASTKGVNYHGYATNDEVRAAVQRAHIFAYPSTFEETSCLSMIEAGAAGCQLVSTYFGALPETGADWATLLPLETTAEDMIKKYAQALDFAIENRNEDKLKRQSEYYNEFYSWDVRKLDWERLLNEI